MMRDGAIIFDMDGLMVDSEALAMESWQEAARREAVAIPDALCIDMIGLNQVDSERLLANRLGEGFPLERVCARYLEELEARLHGGKIEAKAGLYALLDYLESKGVAKAVATSANREEAALKLEAVGVLHRFRVIVTSEQVSRGKPAPDLFVLAAARLGVAPERCTVLEDSEAGVQAAHAAGMRPIMVPDIKQPTPATLRLAARVCASLEEVREFLAKEDSANGCRGGAVGDGAKRNGDGIRRAG